MWHFVEGSCALPYLGRSWVLYRVSALQQTLFPSNDFLTVKLNISRHFYNIIMVSYSFQRFQCFGSARPSAIHRIHCPVNVFLILVSHLILLTFVSFPTFTIRLRFIDFRIVLSWTFEFHTLRKSSPSGSVQPAIGVKCKRPMDALFRRVFVVWPLLKCRRALTRFGSRSGL